MKNNTQFKIGLLCGLIPLAVGLLMFFAWWFARAFFAFDLNVFESYGFLWMLVSIPVVMLGLLQLTFFAFKTHPNFIRQSVLGLCLILMNIPAACWVLMKQADLKKRAYVKINYKNGQIDLSELKLRSNYFEKNTGELERSTSKVFYFYPKYRNEGSNESGSEVEPVTLILGTIKPGQTIELPLPPLYKGQCVKFHIDKDFNLNRIWK